MASGAVSRGATGSNALLCVMTVEIGDGRTGIVNIHAGDDAHTLARSFIDTHGLDEDVLEALTEHIASNQEIARERVLRGGDSRRSTASGQDTPPDSHTHTRTHSQTDAPPQPSVSDAGTSRAGKPAPVTSRPPPEDPPSLAPPSPRTADGEADDGWDTPPEDTHTHTGRRSQVDARRLSAHDADTAETATAGLPEASGTRSGDSSPTRRADAGLESELDEPGQGYGASDAAAEEEYEAMQRQYQHLKSRSSHGGRKMSSASGLSTSFRKSTASVGAGAAPAGRKNTGEPPRPRPSRNGAPACARPTALSAARASGAADAPPKIVPIVGATKTATPQLFDRLYEERVDREQRLAEVAQRYAKAEKAAIEADKKKALMLGRSSGHGPGGDKPTDGSSSPSSRAGTRLYEEGKAAEVRRAAKQEALRTAIEEKEEWVCPACGHTNSGTVSSCTGVTKTGKKVETAAAVGAVAPTAPRSAAQAYVRVCGADRPRQLFQPTISEFAANLARPIDREAYMSLQIEKYLAERRRREELAAEKERAQLAECAFTPAINANSEELSAARRQRLIQLRASSALGATEAVTDLEADDHGSRAAPVSAHELLYADAMQRQAAQRQSTIQPADWHGCTFQPDIGANTHRVPRDESREAFFARLYDEGAAARIRLQALRKRLHEQETAGRSRPPLPPKQHIGPTLYQQAMASLEVAKWAREEEEIRAHEAANTRHTSAGSERLLDLMRQRSLASIFVLLVQSVSVPLTQRVVSPVHAERTTGKDMPDDTGLPPAVKAWMDAAAGRDGAPMYSPKGITPQQLAQLIASVDAHADVHAEDIPSPRDVDPAHYEAVFSDALVSRASGLVLDLANCWPDVLDPALAPFVKVVLEKLRARAAVPASPTCRFDEFCAVMGKLLEDIGGGPHVYLLARRAIRSRSSRSRSSDGLRVRRSSAGGVRRTSLHSEASEADDEASVLERQSSAIMHRMRAEGKLSGADAEEPTLSEMQAARVSRGSIGHGVADSEVTEVPEPVHDRLLRKSEEYAARRRAIQLQHDRHELQLHPFRPQPQTGPTRRATAGIPEGPVQASLLAQVEDLRQRNQGLADRARQILQRSELLNKSASPAASPTAPTVAAPSRPPQESAAGPVPATTAVANSVPEPENVSDAFIIERGKSAAPPAEKFASPAPTLPARDEFGYTPAQPRIRLGPSAPRVPPVPLHTLREIGASATVSPPKVAQESADAASPPSGEEAGIMERLSELSLASLEARINRILAVDPAEVAKASSRSRLGGSAVSVASGSSAF